MIGRARAHMPNGMPMAWMASDNDQPVYIDHGYGPGFTDVDGFTYADFNASDMAMFCGHANPVIVAAVQAQVARSTQFLLPTEASVDVAEELARRYPVSVAVHLVGHASQHRGDPAGPGRHRTRCDRLVPGPLPRPLRGGPGGPGRRSGRRGLSKGVTGRVRIGQFNDAGKVAGLLHGPLAGRVRGDAAEMHTASAGAR